MGFKSKMVYRGKKRITRRKNKYSNKKKVNKRVTRKQKVMRGGALTRGQLAKLEALGYTVNLEGGVYTITGAPSQILINSRLARDVRTGDRFEAFKTYIVNLLNDDKAIPDNINDLAMKYISGCDLEINRVAEGIIRDLLTNRPGNAAKIKEFQDRTKKIGSFLDTSDGLKELTGVQEVIFNELPQINSNTLNPIKLYKYVIIGEGENINKIYYSCASGISHFSYIDYYVKKNYDQNGNLRVNAEGRPTPATHLFFVKNTSIPDKILLAMSWGDGEVKNQWFNLLKAYAQQNPQNIVRFITDNVNNHGYYSNVFNAFGGDHAKIITIITNMGGNVSAYTSYNNDWDTVIMGDEISHSCLTYALEVGAAGEFCTDANGNINYVDGWSGHFKTPIDYLPFILTEFNKYGYVLRQFGDHLAINNDVAKCPDTAAAAINCNNQLARSVTKRNLSLRQKEQNEQRKKLLTGSRNSNNKNLTK